MFTGIVEKVGRIAEVEKRGGGRQPKRTAVARTSAWRVGGDWRLGIATPTGFLKGTKIGDSIAVNGICLTVAGLSKNRFTADLSLETLNATTAKAWRAGAAVNLERALRLGQALGGHLVSGHVDGVGRLVSNHRDAHSMRLVFAMPKPLTRYMARKGSVCIDGVSLTINEIKDLKFGVNIVPHTLSSTTLGQLRSGDRVNIEVDLIARHLERLIAEKT